MVRIAAGYREVLGKQRDDVQSMISSLALLAWRQRRCSNGSLIKYHSILLTHADCLIF